MNTLRIAGLVAALAGAGLSRMPAAHLPAAQVEISRAQQAVVGNPENHEHYNDLALALARHAAETADSDYFALAEGALEESLRLAPGNRQAWRVWRWIARARQRFETSRVAGAALSEQRCQHSPADGQPPDAEARSRTQAPELQRPIEFSGQSEDQ